MVFLLYIFTNLESVVPFQLFQTDTMYLKYVLHERMYMTFRGALFNIYVELRAVHLFKRSIYYRPQKKFGAR